MVMVQGVLSTIVSRSVVRTPALRGVKRSLPLEALHSQKMESEVTKVFGQENDRREAFLTGDLSSARRRNGLRRRMQQILALKLTNKMGKGVLGLGVLGDSSIKPETLKDYARRVAAFCDFLAESEKMVDFSAASEVDMGLVSYANHLFRRGELAGEGEKLKAAIEAFYPDFSRRGPLGLPRYSRVLTGWRRLAPPQPALPVPELILDVITDILLDEGRIEEFLHLHLGFSLYLRPGENAGLCLGDVVKPGAGCKDFGILLCPHERKVMTKVRTFDEALTLDDARAPWLGPALGRHCARRRHVLRSQGLNSAEADRASLWSRDRHHFLSTYRRVCKQLNVLWINDTLYGLRHGGASRDVLLKTRTLEMVMRRGRWAHLDSVRHYERHGRVQWILNKCDAAVVTRGAKARSSFASRLRAL